MILSEILVLRQKVERLEVGQLEIKKEQYMICLLYTSDAADD